MGMDAVPRTARCSGVWDGMGRHELWIPADVDLFVGCADDVDAHVVVEVVRALFGLCAHALWRRRRRARRRRAVLPERRGGRPAAPARPTPSSTPRRPARRARALPDHLAYERSRARTTPDDDAHPTRATWSAPTRTTLCSPRASTWSSRAECPAITRAPSSTMTCAHCAVALACDADGAYRLRARASAARALARRRLELVDGGPARRSTRRPCAGSTRTCSAVPACAATTPLPWDDVVHRLGAAWDE